MSIFSKARVRTAVESRSNMNFNSSHITTSDFFQLSVPYYRHLAPGQSIDVDMSCFSRLAPMPVPTLGNINFKHHAFFVPFKSIMPSWDDFITDTPHVPANSSSTSVPAQIVPFAHRFNSADLLTALDHPIFSASINVQDSGDLDRVDFTFVSGSSQETMNWRQLTDRGRFVYKILRQLGYDIPTDCSALAYNSSTAVYFSALPLLALARVYIDWFYPSQYVGDVDYNTVMSILKHDVAGGYTLTANDLFSILLLVCQVCYDSDYFTSAFDNPAGPNSGFFTSFSIPDVTLQNLYRQGQVTTGPAISGPTATVDTGSTPAIGLTGNSSSVGNYPFLTQYVLNSLHALSDYMKRHQLVGSRALDRYLARFGVKLEQSDRSLLLGSSIQNVSLGAVMSNASTEGASLGDYAGQGYSNDGCHFSFKSDKDYGIFIITTSIVPEIGYVQGVDRNNFHLSKLDFITPEFDALGTQAISASELLTEGLVRTDDSADIKIGSTSGAPVASLHNTFNKIFGFTPRYAEYKVQLSKLTGDFNIPRLSQAGFTSDSWHLYRMISVNDPGDLVHDKNFLAPNAAVSPYSEYDRVFGNTSGAADHFVLVYNFRINSSIPAKPLFDTYDFDEENGRVIEIEAGGVKVN